MSNLKIVGVVLVLAIITYLGISYPKALPQIVLGASPAGSTFNTAKIDSVAINLASPGANGTSTSILNTDANTRYVTATEVGCQSMASSSVAYTGATNLAALLLSVSTSSTAAPAVITNTNLVGWTAMTLSTSTGQFVSASSTASNGASTPGSQALNNIWPAGTYMTFSTNATNTALCTVGVRYLGS